MKIENISNGKIIGIGKVTILPGETKEIPEEYETNPVLEVYKKLKMVKIIGTASVSVKTDNEKALAKAEAIAKAAKEAENIRKERLASLNGISEENLAKLANELGINPAECKDQADVLKKVKSALSK